MMQRTGHPTSSANALYGGDALKEQPTKKSFWEFDPEQGFRAKIEMEEAEHALNSNLQHNHRRISPPAYFTSVHVTKLKPSPYQYAVKPVKPGSGHSGQGTRMTSVTAELSESAISEKSALTCKHKNEHIFAQKIHKRQLEQKLTQQKQRSESYSNNQSCNRVELKQENRRCVMSNSIQNPSISNANILKDHTDRPTGILRPTAKAWTISASPPSPLHPPPPMSVIEFADGTTSSPIKSPIFSPIASMKRMRAASIGGLKNLPLPIAEAGAQDAASVDTKQSKRKSVKSAPNNAVETKITEQTPKTKGRVKRILVRKMPKNKIASVNTDQERLLAEKESEIKRMERRLKELKLIREIQALEEEIKKNSIQPCKSSTPSCPAVKTTSKRPESLSDQPSHKAKNSDPFQRCQTSLAANNTATTTTNLRENNSSNNLNHCRVPIHYPLNHCVAIKSTKKSVLKKQTNSGSFPQHASQSPSAKTHKFPHCSPSKTRTQSSNIMKQKRTFISENFRKLQQSLICKMHGSGGTKSKKPIEKPKFLSADFRQRQKDLLANMKSSATNPHYTA